MSCSNVSERQHSCQQIICNLRENGTGSFSHRPTIIIIIIIFIRLKTHKKKHKHTKQYQRQAAREAKTPINAGRPCS